MNDGGIFREVVKTGVYKEALKSFSKRDKDEVAFEVMHYLEVALRNIGIGLDEKTTGEDFIRYIERSNRGF